MGIVIQGFSEEPYKLVLKLIKSNTDGDEGEVAHSKREEQVNFRKAALKYRH
ncbi:MAG: hypothetical protein M1386_03895 [Candidatus Thermoplasmatota archaeon]|jgi:hypothetical protein|nr:hypothetical protein [Candidatus Thermoplasmatota archaeon]